MKKSTRALVGMVLLDGLVLAGSGYLVEQVESGAVTTTVPRAEAVGTIMSVGGGVIGIITAVLLIAFVVHRRNGN